MANFVILRRFLAFLWFWVWGCSFGFLMALWSDRRRFSVLFSFQIHDFIDDIDAQILGLPNFWKQIVIKSGLFRLAFWFRIAFWTCLGMLTLFMRFSFWFLNCFLHTLIMQIGLIYWDVIQFDFSFWKLG